MTLNPMTKEEAIGKYQRRALITSQYPDDFWVYEREHDGSEWGPFTTYDRVSLLSIELGDRAWDYILRHRFTERGWIYR